jgi:neutral ceramidase
MVEGNVRVGIAKHDITPPIGLPMAGYGAREGYSAGVADPLYARALTVFDKTTEKRIAFVTADLVAFDPETVKMFRDNVRAIPGLRPDDVVLAVTHTHSGPAYGNFYNFYTSDLSEDESDQSIAWGKALSEALVDVLNKAISAEEDAQVLLSSTNVALSVHRRYVDPLGEVRLAPHPPGPVDPTVSVMQMVAEDKVIATLVNYACHPVVLCEDNLLYSGDYPAYLLARLEEQTGAPAIFINGLCGNINPGARGDFDTAKRLGESLAQSVLDSIDKSALRTDLAIHTKTKTVPLPLKHPSSAAFDTYLATATKEMERHANPHNFEGQRLQAEVTRAQSMLTRHVKLRKRFQAMISDGHLTVRIQGMRLGSALFLALPGEVFTEFGLAIRERLASEPIFLLGYTNEAIGYVPTAEAYPQRGYEVDVSHLAEGAGERLFAEVEALLQDLNHSD